MGAKRVDDEAMVNLQLALDAWRVMPHSRPAADHLGKAIRALLIPNRGTPITNHELEAVCQYLRGPTLGFVVTR